jgi:archaemetzincin
MKRVVVISIFCWLLLAISCRHHTPIVGIQPLGEIPQAKLDFIKAALYSIYDVEVVVLPFKPPFEAAFTNLKGLRYRADTTIAILRREKPDTIDYVIGIIGKDICITKYAADGSIKKPEYKYTDFGIFGLGYRPGSACVVSTFRLGDFNTPITKSRLVKVCVHEVGHNFGLPHCPNKKCVMTDAVESIATVDNAELWLCDKCKKKL